MSVEQVPFITLNRFEDGFRDTFLEGVAKLFDNTQFVGGPVVGEVEQKLSKQTGAKYVVGCANGTDAIQIALRAVGVDKNDVVLVPDMTFWATFEAVVNVGANPATVDVNRETLHWDVETFTSAIEKFKPKAAIMVHLYGWGCPDTMLIRKAAKDAGVILIEDGAQCYGTKVDGESILGSAYISTTSFYPAKVLGASGDAGAIFTNDEKLSVVCRQLVNHGRTDHYSHGLIGWNSRIGAYESLFLNLSLDHIDARLESRRKAVDYYVKHLEGLPLKIVTSKDHVHENGYCSVGLIDPALRPALIESLKAAKVGYGTIYPGAMSLQSGAKDHLVGKIDFGNAHYISQAVLNLPCFAYITEEELKYVVDVVKKHFQK
ncbi:DegT/DnrJ/EryC1/StrS aminotransferase family protein [Bacteriovorax sp. BSW11_IV]|uniref:DegT/DnrJ/EryC1/StrS family aminotransferase n=1 Tax=Bacteriovorax sp. BSW11_IV TaxID=1353529 RepID=UPI000389F631|nr:DegT/DnrJ/EryC1/StrS family aminotransferase [Bacteriovorax sp. BSW11_IV]EQC48997.1 DegT/DnrJ/EryC1/StrS aminotransferase family protein [Bacteriovorax sp. BSW11_IV]